MTINRMSSTLEEIISEIRELILDFSSCSSFSFHERETHTGVWVDGSGFRMKCHDLDFGFSMLPEEEKNSGC